MCYVYISSKRKIKNTEKKKISVSIKGMLLNKQYSAKKNTFNTCCILRFKAAFLQEIDPILPKQVNYAEQSFYYFFKGGKNTTHS